MLGRLRRTTRLDVSLALALSGTSYLVWALVAGISRSSVQQVFENIHRAGCTWEGLSPSSAWVKTMFVDAGIAIDVVGLAWLAVSLLLIVFSSRQYFSISWAWVSVICQSFTAGLGAVLVGWAGQQPYELLITPTQAAPPQTTWAQVSGFSLLVTLVLAVVVWVAFLAWLLIDRARWTRSGPSLRDGMRSNVTR